MHQNRLQAIGPLFLIFTRDSRNCYSTS